MPLWAQNLFGSAFYIFLLRQFFLGLPRELFEAARVDGCGYFGMFWRIALPLSVRRWSSSSSSSSRPAGPT